MKKNFILLAAICALSACNSKSVEERAVELYEGMGEIAEQNKGNCDALGEKLEAYVHDHEGVIEDLKALSKQKGASFDPVAWNKQYGQRMRVAGQKMRKMASCESHPKVISAMRFMISYIEETEAARNKEKLNSIGTHHHDHGDHDHDHAHPVMPGAVPSEADFMNAVKQAQEAEAKAKEVVREMNETAKDAAPKVEETAK